MPTTKRTFLKGRMNLDIDERLLQDGEYREASNIRVSNSEGSDVGAIEKSLSNKVLTTLSLGTNIYTLGSLRDEFEEKIYWAVLSDNGCYIIEHEVETGTTTFVLQDTRVGVANVLGFVPDKRLQMALIVDSDNDNRLLVFTDNNTQPKCINVERAKTYGENGFDEEMILLIKKPPLDAPVITLENTATEEENNIRDRFLKFAYRYEYLDGEYSALSPFTEVGFGGLIFSYDYSTATNKSMLNLNNQIDIEVNTGSSLVKSIEIVFKESRSNTIYSIHKFIKEDEGLLDDDALNYKFNNSKIYKTLPEKELWRLYDNVPLLAKALAVINNRIAFGQYTENYDLTDAVNGDEIKIDFSLNQINSTIENLSASNSLKSIRDYEVGIAYLDGYGRMTTPLISSTNTIHIAQNNCITQNSIEVEIPKEAKAPYFAEHYRFFIKQSKNDYDTLASAIFYKDEGYVWLKIEANEIDKVKEGDYLYVKSDTDGILDTVTEVKVLEVKEQDKNFLETDDTITETLQQQGNYIKLRPIGFSLDEEDYVLYEWDGYDTSRNRHDTTIRSDDNYTEIPVFYGVSSQDDLTVDDNLSYTGTEDIRYEVEITDAGTPNKFIWKSNGSFSTAVDITGVSQALDNNVAITFGSTTGHSVGDKWIISAKSSSVLFTSPSNKAYSIFKSIDANGEPNVLDVIEVGAEIYMKMRSIQDSSGYALDFEETFISNSRYANLEEWFYGDNIMSYMPDTGDWVNDEQVFFRRGNVGDDDGADYITIDPNGDMCMIIESWRNQGTDTDGYVRARVNLNIKYLNSLVIFETQPLVENTDIFYEIGRTYSIDANRNHLAFDGSDQTQTDLVNGKFILPSFNCISWGNGFESYKIKDEFNGKSFMLDSRPSTTIENYRQNKRIASYTYSNVYEQSTNYNALNEFNLGLVNYNDLDDKYGGIQAMVSWDNDLDVWQEDKVTKVLYDKSVIYNKDGSSNLAKSDDILKNVIPYAGEYGISTHPESLAVYGNYTYWADAKRGAFVRKGQSGIEVISNFGIRDWTRDNMTNLTTYILGCYDPYFGQYVVSLNGYTLTFNELGNAWTSFHSWIPDEMVRINNRFFSFKEGQLYLHNDSDNAQVNNFYGTKYSSTVETIINEAPSEDKIFKNIIQESTSPWKVTIETNLSNGTIEASEFNQRESKWFAHTRKNESASLNDRVQGIGNIVSINANEITFGQMPTLVSIGETLYQLNTGVPEEVGVISDIQGNVITVSAIITTPVADLFAYSVKDARVQGGEIRGYYAKVTLENDDDANVELFAINSNIIKSYAPTGHQ